MYIKHVFAIYLIMSIALLPSIAIADAFPDLMGRQLGEAQYLATKSNIEVVFQKVDSLQTRDKVLDQIPAGGTEIGRDRRVFLRVSDGIVVPDLTGKALADAQAVLTQLGVGFASSDRRHVGFVKGAVASQVPRAAQRMDAAKQIVFLDIVGGRYVVVPDVNGKHLSDALATIQKGELAASENPANSSFAQRSAQESQISCQTVRTSTAIASSTQPPAGTEIYPGQQVVVNWSMATSDRKQWSRTDECRPPPKEPCPPKMCK